MSVLFMFCVGFVKATFVNGGYCLRVQLIQRVQNIFCMYSGGWFGVST